MYNYQDYLDFSHGCNKNSPLVALVGGVRWSLCL